MGAEGTRNTLFSSPNSVTNASFQREAYSFFGEARVPILGKSSADSGNQLEATFATRYDHYNDFGSASSPQMGVAWRPLRSLLIRGTYSEAFKAPSLFDLNRSQSQFPNVVADPLRGNEQAAITETFGGNRKLRPETGKSHTFGAFYSQSAAEGLQLSATHWRVLLQDSIQALFSETLVPNESLFPGAVVRAPSQDGRPGVITQVNDSSYNFGKIEVSGIDYQIEYRYRNSLGQWTPSISATQTYRYQAALVPGAPPSDRTSKANDDGNFSPRWKGTASLGWKKDQLTANAMGRYVGRYTDYNSTRTIGDFWLFDANLRYEFGKAFASSPWLAGAFVELGGVNLLDKDPQFSNFGFGRAGYDPTQSDIRGRFLYLRLGARF